MRVSVLGNSDTTGLLLPPGTRTWPALLEERLRDTLREPVTVDSWRFAPYRAGAVEHAVRLVDGAEPDLVIITLASYWCGFGTVHARVAQRFGSRAARRFNRGQRAYTQPVAGGVHEGRTDRSLGRRMARRVIGTQALMSLPQFVDVYSTLLRELALKEQRQVLVLADHHYTPEIHRMLPGLRGTIVEIERAIKPIVVERKFLWGDLEDAITEGGRREQMILSDGIHMTEEAHGRVARALLPVVTRVAQPV